MRIAIVEDDRTDRDLLDRLLHRYEEDAGITVHITKFASSVEMLTSYKPVWDLILLDIEMPVQDGMAAARQIREMDDDVMIMFITRFSRYAAEGYEVAAVDFLLKPVNYEIFAVKMNRVLHLLHARSDRSLIIRSQDSTRRINLRALYYVEIFNHTMEYHTEYGSFTSTGRKSIRSLEKELKEDGFVLSSQSHLVNLRYVEAVENDGIVLSGGVRLPLSRSRRKEFMQELMLYWTG